MSRQETNYFRDYIFPMRRKEVFFNSSGSVGRSSSTGYQPFNTCPSSTRKHIFETQLTNDKYKEDVRKLECKSKEEVRKLEYVIDKLKTEYKYKVDKLQYEKETLQAQA